MDGVRRAREGKVRYVAGCHANRNFQNTDVDSTTNIPHGILRHEQIILQYCTLIFQVAISSNCYTMASGQDAAHHKRVKSSVFKSFIHKRTPSAGAGLSSAPADDVFISTPAYTPVQNMPLLPAGHAHATPLAEIPHHNQTRAPSSPKKSREGKRPNSSEDSSQPVSMHKKTLSSISLKSLAGRETEKSSKSKSTRPSSPKKTKSATNITNILTRPKSSKTLRKQAEEDRSRGGKGKENRTPPPTDEDPRPPPIYAQFSSEFFAQQPLGGKFLEDEIDLYTPQNYSPGKQRNFYQGPDSQPALVRREDQQRPKSTFLPSSFSIQDLSRRVSAGSRHSSEMERRASVERRPKVDRKNTEDSTKHDKTKSSRRQRVLSVVTGGMSNQRTESEQERILEDKDVDKEFEAMLDRRNIPEHQRGKMRSLAVLMKKDFVKQDWAEIAAAKNGRPGTNSSASSADASTGTQDVHEAPTKRPRSRTFTLSRASSKDRSSSTKKQKPQATFGRHSRTNSSDSMHDGGKSLTTSSAAVAQTLIAKAKGQLPHDFVSYLKKVQKPSMVEVGRLHKLRLLLRNETVAWTDEFIGQGGMEEIVGLLHRTMDVEWRQVICPSSNPSNADGQVGRSTKMLCFMKHFFA